jgi:uncharacterized protein YukE
MVARNGNLEQAIALLVQNQALFQSEMSQAHRDIREIKDKLDMIQKTLIKHHETLEALPEAIRLKIGFKVK